MPQHIKALLGAKIAPVNYALAFIANNSTFKSLKRTGWVDRNIPEPKAETISDRMSVLP